MVKLTKIYTKQGDEGITSVVGNVKLSKSHMRLEVIGEIDETNSLIGLAIAHINNDAIIQELRHIQHDLFDLGADMATSLVKSDDLRVSQKQVTKLENRIDSINQHLSALNSFILPGGNKEASFLHLTRTVVRRAERSMVKLNESEPLNPIALCYINRLSDYFFVLARKINDGHDILWQPGFNQ